MDDARGVGSGEAPTGPQEDVDDLAPPARFGPKPGIERLAVHELHRHVDVLAHGAGVMDGDDVRVRESSNGSRLSE